MYLEFARALTMQVLSNQPKSPDEGARLIFRRLLTRLPNQEEVHALVEYQRGQRKRLDAGELNAAEICNDEDATPDMGAWAMVTRAVMNLDETITKP